MKQLHLILVLSLLGVSSSMAQEDVANDNAIKANPLGLLLGIGKINYEKKLSDSRSAQLGVSYFNYGNSGDRLSGLGIIPEYRFYIKDDAIDGFYVAPFLKYNNFTVTDGDFKGALNIYSGGAKAGMQWLLGKKDNFIIDLAFGGSYSDYNLKVKTGSDTSFDSEDLLSGIGLELNFSIGFAF